MPRDFRIIDAQTGEAIPDVVAFTVTSHAQDEKLCMATLTVFAEIDIEVDARIQSEAPPPPPAHHDPGVLRDK
jgi:hypothetical protein